MCLLCFATSLPRRKSNPFLKWSAFFFSLCCLLAGALVIALSLVLSFKTSFSYVFFNDNHYYGGLLAGGVALTIVGLFGCIGALADNNCLLYTFALFALVLIAGEIAIGVLVYKNTPDFVENLQSDIRQGVELDYGENTTITSRIDAIQQGWSCCGTTSPSSWSKSKYGRSATKDFNEQRGTYFVPESCCIDQNSKSCANIHRLGVREKNELNHLHQEGCLRMLSDSVNNYRTVAFVTLTVMIMCQLIAMLLALIMAYQLGKMHHTELYISREQYEVNHQASAPMLSSATSMDSHKMFDTMPSMPSSVNVSKSSLNHEPTTMEISKSSLV